ncbi:MAG: CFI-box-CTERM domain-containing protein [Desulfobaccales bacterium]
MYGKHFFFRELRTIDSKYAKYSTEQLEVILTHLSDPAEKDLVKTELSKRYYNHYLGILHTPDGQAETAAPSTPEGPASPAGGAETPGQPTGQTPPAASAALEEDLAGIPEVSPISLQLPPSQETAHQRAEQKVPGKGKRRFCFIATAAYGSPLAPEVTVLQDFRDTYLARHSLGERCIEAYYRISPLLAHQISRHQALQRLTRFFLAPIILLLKKKP